MYVCLLQPIDKLITILSIVIIVIIISLAMSLIKSFKLLHSTERSGCARNIKKIFLAFCLIEIICIVIKMEDTSAIIQGNFTSIICFFKFILQFI